MGKLSLGWIKHHNQDKFEIYCYYLGDFSEDKITQEFKQHSNKFYHFKDDTNIEIIAQAIKDNDLDFFSVFGLKYVSQNVSISRIKVSSDSMCYLASPHHIRNSYY